MQPGVMWGNLRELIHFFIYHQFKGMLSAIFPFLHPRFDVGMEKES